VNHKLANCCRRLSLPLVNVWFNSPLKDDFPGVFPDMAAIGVLRAEHLLSRGLRRFAVLTSDDNAEKVASEAFHATIAEAGGQCIHENISLDPSRTFATWQRTEQRIEAWMKRWQLPIGISIASEEVARMVIQICRRYGWRVPGDVAIIAGTNEEVLCDHPRPSLTSVESGYERIGYEAARILDELMRMRNDRRRKRMQPPRQVQLPPQGLIVRESTDFYAVDDEVVTQALRFIAANSHRDINVDDVAKALALHPRTLQRRFREVVDWPIVEEIQRVRIERAKRELTQSKRSIKAIAQDVGFGDGMRMYEVFRRELGITPTAYRKQRQLNSAP
jgi:LacI family transcriptional regulator